MPGFGFGIAVSKNIPPDFQNKCLVHGEGNPIIVTSQIEKAVYSDAVNLRMKSLRAECGPRMTTNRRVVRPAI